MDFVVTADSAFGAWCVSTRSLRVAVAPLLCAWLTWRELLTAHGAGSTLALVGSGLRLSADCPFSTSTSDVSPRREWSSVELR